jgi:hypothetical protein
MEALCETDSLIQRGYPVQSTGLYTREPAMGQLVRDAISIGFIPIQYDCDVFENREYESVLNLYNNTLKQDTTAHVVVLAGIGHIRKASPKKMMVSHFGELSGIVPYTIEQTHGELYTRQMQENNTLHLMQGDADCDLYVMNNLSLPFQGQNIDMKNNLPLINMELPKDVIQYLSEQQNLLLSIFREDEFSAYEWQSVPVLNYLLTIGQKHISLSIPSGQYVCIIRTATGEEMFRQIVNVEV